MSMGADGRVLRARTLEPGPPSVCAENVPLLVLLFATVTKIKELSY